MSHTAAFRLLRRLCDELLYTTRLPLATAIRSDSVLCTKTNFINRYAGGMDSPRQINSTERYRQIHHFCFQQTQLSMATLVRKDFAITVRIAHTVMSKYCVPERPTIWLRCHSCANDCNKENKVQSPVTSCARGHSQELEWWIFNIYAEAPFVRIYTFDLSHRCG